MKLPQFNTQDKSFSLMQSAWKSAIDPVISSPQNNSLILKNVVLTTGSNTVNHLLGRKLQGWKLTRQRAAADIHDNQDTNPHPEITLILVSSGNVTVDLELF